MSPTKAKRRADLGNSYERGKALADAYNPGLEEALEERYGELLPEMPRDLIGFVYGQHYDPPGLSYRDRSLATIAALTAFGRTDSSSTSNSH